MKLKTSLSVLSLAVCAAVGGAAQAQSFGTLTITGFINAMGCTPSLNGSSLTGATLNLDDAQATDLANPGDTTGEKEFTFQLSGCSTGTVNNMWVHFSGGNVDTEGRLRTNNSNVRFELLDGPGGTAIRAGGVAGNAGPAANQGTATAFGGSNPTRSAVKTYAVRYYAQNALTPTDTGHISSQVTYNVHYY